jgi:hypothetical protein
MAGQATGQKPEPWWARYRIFLYLVLGLLALDMAVASFRHVWRAYDPDDYRDRIENCRAHPADLVVVGGSPVAEGIDPAELASLYWRGQILPQAYNLGLPGATALEVGHAVRHGLSRPPRLLIYGITASDLNDSRLEPHGPRSLMTIGDLVELARSSPKTAAWCLRHYSRQRLSDSWNLFHFRNGIRLWAANCLDRLWPGLCPAAAAEARAGLRYTASMKCANGFAPQPEVQARRLDQMKAAGWTGQPFRFLDHYQLGQHVHQLHGLLDWAATHGVDLVLVDMPVSQDLEERLHPREFAQYRAALAKLEKSRGVRVLHARRAAVGLTDADFGDLIHLNAQGTALLSRWLRQQLAVEL